jgi:hypothetical protein
MTQQRRGRWRESAQTIASVGAALALASASAHVAFAAASATRAPREPPLTRTARALNIDDTAHLHLLNASGSVLSEEGPVSGTLPGRARVRLVVGTRVLASFTIKPRGGGSIIGSGSATLHSSSRYSSFGGSLSVVRGTGRYAHAHGSGKLYGVIDRRTDEVTVQTIGTLAY